MGKTKGSSTGAALDIFRLLKRHFDKGVSVRALAEETGISERTIYRAIRAFRKDGINGLQRITRADKGKRRSISDEVKEAVEGLCLRQPKPPVAWVHRQVAEACQHKGLPVPGYWVVLDIYRKLDRRLKTLMHEGEKAFDQEFDPLLMREAEGPNEMWQCDHKDLKIWAVDQNGRVGKVWLTASLDDYSRMITGYYLAIGAPNSTRIATTLRQAIWSKNDARWPVAGIPEVFYSDHGADFTSTHIEQIAADLGMQLVNTIVYKPRGRGKIERFFRTVAQMFCPSHNTKREKPKPLTQIESAFREWLDSYHHRKHREIKMAPVERWSAAGFLPRLPESLDSLDLMLMKVSKPRTMTGVGIRFDRRRYSDEVLTESNGEQFDIRYDPRDLSYIWVYGEGGKLVCKAECKGLHPTKEETAEVISNRQRVKKRLRKDAKAKQVKGESFLSNSAQEEPVSKKTDDKQPQRRLRKHFHERN